MKRTSKADALQGSTKKPKQEREQCGAKVDCKHKDKQGKPCRLTVTASSSTYCRCGKPCCPDCVDACHHTVRKSLWLAWVLVFALQGASAMNVRNEGTRNEHSSFRT